MNEPSTGSGSPGSGTPGSGTPGSGGSVGDLGAPDGDTVARDPIAIDSIESLQAVIQQSASVLSVGRRTKPPLSAVDPAVTLVSTGGLSGIVEYEPSEFTFTALAGTTIREIEETLRGRNQYLPFDPLLVRDGATLGGTVAAGTSGPGRHRFGGVRDFILGVDFIDGDGALIRSGGKVVKNAAGFDIPKLLVGSCGRLAAMTTLTFKVFPQPVARHSVSIDCEDHQQASALIAAIARGRWELDAIDYRAATRTLWLRIGADRDVSAAIVADIAATIELPQPVIQAEDRAGEFWGSLAELQFGGSRQDCVIKLPLTLRQMSAVAEWCDRIAEQATLHVSVAGALGWLAIRPTRLGELEQFLTELGMRGLVLRRGSAAGGCLIGSRATAPIEAAVKQAMDPPGRFPSLTD